MSFVAVSNAIDGTALDLQIEARLLLGLPHDLAISNIKINALSITNAPRIY
jgi:hypothetical protein